MDRLEIVDRLSFEIKRFEEVLGDLGPGAGLRDALEKALAAVKARWRKDAKARAYEAALDALPKVSPSRIVLDRDRVGIGGPGDLSADQQKSLLEAMETLIPWRKGPFDLFGTALDTEWASNLKWDRLKDHIAPLEGRRILDVGSSSGYYLWRMAAARPRLALGIEPYLTYFAQYLLLQRFVRHPRVFCLPLKLDQLPDMPAAFETLFCMGILYHTRDPLGMLARMRRHLAPGGELVLETLVIEGPEHEARCLCPPGRYAKMANVWFIPSVAVLTHWLERSGFGQIRCIDVSPTTRVEQGRTRWMPFESLGDFLDSADPTKTIEGHPAPVRGVLLATAS
jgi:tRNA (mo5U34)-methyltransferase